MMDVRKYSNIIRIKCVQCNANKNLNLKTIDLNRVKHTRTKKREKILFESEKEISLNQELEESIRKFFEFYDEFIQKKTQLESDVFDQLSFRFQIYEHREMRKERKSTTSLWILLIRQRNRKKFV